MQSRSGGGGAGSGGCPGRVDFGRCLSAVATGDIRGSATTSDARVIRSRVIRRPRVAAPRKRRAGPWSQQVVTALTVARVEVGVAGNGEPTPVRLVVYRSRAFRASGVGWLLREPKA